MPRHDSTRKGYAASRRRSRRVIYGASPARPSTNMSQKAKARLRELAPRITQPSTRLFDVSVVLLSFVFAKFLPHSLPRLINSSGSERMIEASASASLFQIKIDGLLALALGH